MKKLLFLLLLLSIGLLAAVESDPSGVVGYVKYELVVGNNTIALPMLGDVRASASSVGNDIPGCGTVRYFDAVNQVWIAANKAPFPPHPWGPEDFAVAQGDPLWITTTTAGNYYSIGNLPDALASYTLYVGNNFIMVPLDRSDLSLASLVGNDIPGCGTVRYFDGVNQVWIAANKAPFPPHPWGPDDFATAIGDALWITTTIAGTWPGAATRTMSK